MILVLFGEDGSGKLMAAILDSIAAQLMKRDLIYVWSTLIFYPLFNVKFNLQYTEEFHCNVNDTWPAVWFNQRCTVHVYSTYIYCGCSSQWILYFHSTVKQRTFCDCISTWWFQRWINPFSYKLTGTTILQRKFNVESTLMDLSFELDILKQKINVDSRLILSS